MKLGKASSSASIQRSVCDVTDPRETSVTRRGVELLRSGARSTQLSEQPLPVAVATRRGPVGLVASVVLGGLLAVGAAWAQAGEAGRPQDARPAEPAVGERGLTPAGQGMELLSEPASAVSRPVAPQAMPAEPVAEPETVLLPTADATNLSFSQGADRRPSFSSDGRWIAFESDRDGQWELYRMRVDGSHQERLTFHPASDRSPSYSPDGRYLVFQSNRKPGDRRSDLYLLDLELDEITQLSDDEADEAFPRFSPDGRWILYTASPEGNADLFRMPLSGSPPVPGPAERLTDDPANDLWGAYTADGAAVIFYSQRDGNDEIYRLTLADGRLERLTDFPANEFVPALSRDGRWLAFASNRRGAGLTRVFILDLEGKVPLAELEEDSWAGEPAFSPDGRYLAMVSARSRSFEILRWEIPQR